MRSSRGRLVCQEVGDESVVVHDEEDIGLVNYHGNNEVPWNIGRPDPPTSLGPLLDSLPRATGQAVGSIAAQGMGHLVTDIRNNDGEHIASTMAGRHGFRGPDFGGCPGNSNQLQNIIPSSDTAGNHSRAQTYSSRRSQNHQLAQTHTNPLAASSATLPQLPAATSAASSSPGTSQCPQEGPRSKHPAYALKVTRLVSYEQWPRDHAISPENLADAGFFYTGFDYNCTCFYCGGTLRNWESTDDPYVEHARWFPHCSYIRQCRGRDFVRVVKSLHDSGKTVSLRFISVDV